MSSDHVNLFPPSTTPCRSRSTWIGSRQRITSSKTLSTNSSGRSRESIVLRFRLFRPESPEPLRVPKLPFDHAGGTLADQVGDMAQQTGQVFGFDQCRIGAVRVRLAVAGDHRNR